MQGQKIFVTVLCSSSSHSGWLCPELARNLYPILGSKRHKVDGTFIDSIRPFHNARNESVKRFMASGADWLLTIDNDNAPPANLLDVFAQIRPEHDAVLFPYYSWWNERNTPSPVVYTGSLDDGSLEFAPVSSAVTQNRPLMVT